MHDPTGARQAPYPLRDSAAGTFRPTPPLEFTSCYVGMLNEFSLCTSKFESDLPSHAVGLTVCRNTSGCGLLRRGKLAESGTRQARPATHAHGALARGHHSRQARTAVARAVRASNRPTSSKVGWEGSFRARMRSLCRDRLEGYRGRFRAVACCIVARWHGAVRAMLIFASGGLPEGANRVDPQIAGPVRREDPRLRQAFVFFATSVSLRTRPHQQSSLPQRAATVREIAPGHALSVRFRVPPGGGLSR
jgi:hypothetical protein